MRIRDLISAAIILLWRARASVEDGLRRNRPCNASGDERHNITVKGWNYGDTNYKLRITNYANYGITVTRPSLHLLIRTLIDPRRPGFAACGRACRARAMRPGRFSISATKPAEPSGRPINSLRLNRTKASGSASPSSKSGITNYGDTPVFTFIDSRRLGCAACGHVCPARACARDASRSQPQSPPNRAAGRSIRSASAGRRRRRRLRPRSSRRIGLLYRPMHIRQF